MKDLFLPALGDDRPANDRNADRGTRGFAQIAAALSLLAGLLTFVTAEPVSAVTDPDICYIVADAGGANGGNDWLVSFDRTSPPATPVFNTIGTGTGTNNIEAADLWPGNDTLYAVDADELGTIDLATGVYTTLGAPFGTANGSNGPFALTDADGIAFDPFEFFIWAVERNEGTPNLPDLMFKIDPATGAFIPDAFGPGVDYVVSTPVQAGSPDLDDIAVSTVTGEIFAVANSGNSVASQYLVKLDPLTGAQTEVGPFGVADIEGLTFSPDGFLFATDGTNELFYDVDPATGAASNVRDIGVGDDYESVSCLTGDVNRVSGTVFIDVDADGTLDPPEDVGEPAVTVELVRDTDGDGVADPGEPVVGTRVTDANGDYDFEVAASGDFVVRVVQADLPTGSTLTTPPERPVTFVGLGNTVIDQDFGVDLSATVGDFVFVDLDGDGIQDGGEPGISGVAVELFDAGGNSIATTSTGAAGEYSFDVVGRENYTIVVTPPAGRVFTGQDVGGDDIVDSDVDAGGSTGTITPNAGANPQLGDAGILPPPITISGSVWSDPEDDGIIGTDDTAIDDVTIELVDSGGNVVDSTTTLNGDYSFTNVAPGTYTIRETQPPTYADGAEVPGTNGATSVTDNEIVVTVANGETSVDNDFFEVPGASIAGTVFEDPNNNGLQESAPGIGGITMTLSGTDDGGNAVNRTTTTSTTPGTIGDYQFDNLRPGTYTVTEGPTPGYGDGIDTLGSEGGDDSVNDTFSAIPLGANVAATDYDFAELLDPSLSGSVLDENGDPIAGVRITVDDGAGFTTFVDTLADGSYSFPTLPPGTYTVTETQPVGYSDVSTTAGSAGGDDSVQNVISGVVIDYGDTATDYDFVEGFGSIAGTVYEDTNNNGVQDAGEPGIPGASVSLSGTDDRGNVINVTVPTSSVAGSEGTYLFDDLFSGTYEVTEVTPAGFLDGTDADGSTGGTATNPGDAISGVSLDPGEDATDHDFGEILPGTISGTVRDENGAPIGGVDVTLTGTDDLGAITAVTVQTQPDGTYVFSDLRPGTYTVTETQPAGFGEGGESSDDAGATVATNVISDLTVGSGDSNENNDFVETYASIAGTVYEDLNDNGVQDAGEPGISGADVTLNGTDPNGAITAVTVATGADGSYLFSDLLAGDYTVTEVTPPTYVDGTDVAGSVGGTAVNPGDEINSIPLPAGTDAVDYDFGELVVGSISGTVRDENGAPIGGVDVTLTGTDDQGAITAVTVQTQPDGTYAFTDLRPGTYTVTETQPAGYGEGGESTDDAGATVATNVISDLTVAPGDSNENNDFVETYASIAGTVYEDVNDNGVQDAGEPGIPGADVTLNGTDPNGAITAVTVATGADGSYLFSDLLAGDYTVTEVTPPAFADGTDVAGSVGGTAVNPGDEINSIPLPAGIDAVDYDFGELVSGSISGTVRDENGAPIGGVDVTLTGVDDLGAITAVTVQTQPDGTYAFTDLRPGTYTVTETQPAGYGEGGESTDDAGATVATNVISDLTVGPSDSNENNDFVETYASIAGTVYEDTNNNGVQDAGEPGISGADVTLNGTDPNGAITPVTVATGADGSYLFSDLLAGDYTVTEITPPAFADGTDVAGSVGGTAVNPGDEINSIPLPAGTDAVDYDFGELVVGSISGTVRDENGAPIGGVDVTLTGTDDLGAITAVTVQTEPDGTYVFDGLRPGTYTVTETQPAGYGEGGESTDDAGATLATNVISDLTVASGDSNENNDFVETFASIAGTVYEDLNNNGVQDAGEPGIPGAIVALSGTDDRGNVVNVTVPTSSAAGSEGTYLFGDLFSGSYTVTEITPAGFLDGTDVAGSVGGTAVNPGDEINTIPLPAGTDAVDYDFGEIASGTVSGAVRDENGAPIGGVDVTLTGTDDLGAITAVTVQTEPDGTYVFDGLRPGTYTVTETQPAGYGEGGESTDDAGATVATNVISDLTVAPGDSNENNDFVETYASIAGTVYQDLNNNGVQDAGEPGIPGAFVSLSGTDDRGNVVNVTVPTSSAVGSEGTYLFDELFSGSYTVTEVTPSAFADGTDVAGSVGGTAVNPGDEINSISLPVGTDAVDYDFGEIVSGSISGTVRDENGAPIGGVDVTLTGTDDLGAITAVTVQTQPDGTYVFPDLRPGTYAVTETQPAGYGEGGESTDDAGATVATNVISDLTVGQGDTNENNDFVETFSSIAGTVYVDVNDNGVQDAGEPGISGAEVTLNGTDPNGAIVAVTVATGADGSYQFSDLLAGDYTVTEVTPPAFADGTDAAGSVGGTAVNPGDEINSIPLPAGTDAVDYDFGELGTVLSGSVFVDDDRDGTIGATEDARVEGVTIILLDSGGNEIARTTTGPDGTYVFGSLAAGDYTVVQEQPGQYGTTTQNRLDVSVPPAGLADVDFGEDLGSIGNFAFRDANGNGVQDAGEPGVPDVQVQLLDSAGNVIRTVTTGADGSYLFDRLFPESYSVKFVPLDGDALTEPGKGDDETGSDPDWITGTTTTVVLSIDGATGLVDRRADVDAGIVDELIDLSVTASVDKTSVKVGDKVTFTFTPSNNSTVPVIDGAKVVVTIPPSVKIDDVIAPGWAVAIDGNNVILTLDQPLLPGDPLPVIDVITTVVDASAGSTATAVIGTVNGDIETTFENNADDVAITVAPVPPPVVPGLPGTGGETGNVLRLAALAAMLGLALWVSTRRRAKTTSVG